MMSSMLNFYNSSVKPKADIVCSSIAKLDQPCTAIKTISETIEGKMAGVFPKPVCVLTKLACQSSHYIAMGLLLPPPIYTAIAISIIANKTKQRRSELRNMETLANGMIITSFLHTCKHIVSWDFYLISVNIIATSLLLTYSNLPNIFKETPTNKAHKV